eukprot:scaffold67063_cov91-Phaeocystis_antarctica.AAC.2
MPSTAEQAWLTGEAQGRICNITKQPLVKAAVAAWMAYSASPGVWAPGGKPDPKPSPEQAAALSYFELNVSHSTPAPAPSTTSRAVAGSSSRCTASRGTRMPGCAPRRA